MHPRDHRRAARVKRLFRPAVLFSLVLAFGVRLPALGAAESPGAWRDWVGDTGSRYGHVAVGLGDGRLLAAGGFDDTGDGLLASAVLFDPSGGVTRIDDMSVPRYHPAGALLDDGSVLVTGGYGGQASADRYIFALGRWITAAAMRTPRWAHTATLLGDGRLLVVGGASVKGLGVDETLRSAEIYHPLSNSWTPAASMGTARHSHTATLLADGRVLVVGGNGSHLVGSQLASAEIYDPSTDTWSPTPDMTVPRVEHTATLLPDGGVFVAGGAEGDNYWSGSEIFDPAAGQWIPAGDMLAARAGHTATALDDGRILVAGGLDRWNDALATAEIYDPRSGHRDPATSMAVPRYLHTATLLGNGRSVAFVGGWNADGATGDVALYQQ